MLSLKYVFDLGFQFRSEITDIGFAGIICHFRAMHSNDGDNDYGCDCDEVDDDDDDCESQSLLQKWLCTMVFPAISIALFQSLQQFHHHHHYYNLPHRNRHHNHHPPIVTYCYIENPLLRLVRSWHDEVKFPWAV